MKITDFGDHRMMRRTFLLFVVLCASLTVFSTSANADIFNMFKKAEPTVQQAPTEQLISSDLLSHSGLKAAWQINLPIQTNESLGRMYINGNMLYVFTDSNYMFGIERKKGISRFGIRIANPGLPILAPKFYEGKIYITVGNRLQIIDSDLGYVTDSRQLDIIGKFAVCPFERNDDVFYAVGSNRRLYFLDPTDYFILHMVSAYNDSLINSIVVDNERVVFAAESGNIVNLPVMMKTPVWQTDIAAGLAAPVVRDGDALYVSSLDMKLYRLNMANGYSAWETPFQTGQPLRTSARVGKNLIYQYAGTDGVYAVDKITGKMAWNLPDGFDLLCELGSRAYVIGEPAMIYVMDNAKKKLVYSVNAAGATSYAVNTTDSTMYIAAKDGRLLAINIANPKFEVK